jgi:pilus assembly protein CpaE
MRGELLPLLSVELPLMPVIEVEVYPPKQSLAETVESQSPNVVLLDVCTDPERALALIPDALAVSQNLHVVVLMNGKEPDLLRCLRQGASEFLVTPFSSDQLLAAMERLARLQPAGGFAESTSGKVYCVMPAKGACGATTIASNLAYQWKRLGSSKTLLADLDPLTGTVAFLLKLKSTYSFVDALTRSGSLDEDLWKKMVVSTGNVDVLLSPENPVDAIHNLQDATPIVEYSRQFYETVVIDASGVYGDWSLDLARLCDEILLVCTNELPALQAAQRALAYLDRNRIDRVKIHVVVNRFCRDIGLSREMIETALHSEVYHVLPSDYDGVQRALLEGKPTPPTSSFGKSLSALADRLSGKESPLADADARKGPLGGLFARLLGR